MELLKFVIGISVFSATVTSFPARKSGSNDQEPYLKVDIGFRRTSQDMDNRFEEDVSVDDVIGKDGDVMDKGRDVIGKNGDVIGKERESVKPEQDVKEKYEDPREKYDIIGKDSDVILWESHTEVTEANNKENDVKVVDVQKLWLEDYENMIKDDPHSMKTLQADSPVDEVGEVDATYTGDEAKQEPETDYPLIDWAKSPPNHQPGQSWLISDDENEQESDTNPRETSSPSKPGEPSKPGDAELPETEYPE